MCLKRQLNQFDAPETLDFKHHVNSKFEVVFQITTIDIAAIFMPGTSGDIRFVSIAAN